MSTLLAWSLLVSWRLLWANHHHHQFTEKQLTMSRLPLAWSWAVCTMSSSEKCLFGLIYYISGHRLMQCLDASRFILLHAKKWLRNLSWHEMTVYCRLWATNINHYFQLYMLYRTERLKIIPFAEALSLGGLGGGVRMSQSEFQISLFRILRSRPCPCQYLTHLYVVCLSPFHLSSISFSYWPIQACEKAPWCLAISHNSHSPH